MKYISTRGGAAQIDFDSAVLAGLAPDGGLYVPSVWPTMSETEIEALSGRTFSEIAAAVLSRFVVSPGGDLDQMIAELQPLAEKAFASFDHGDVTPLTDLGGNKYYLELFHGPTLAFKDVAMQFLGQLFSRSLKRLEKSAPKTIIGATSGDTGGAAIAAFADAPGVNVFMLHPRGRISDVQRRIMTVNPAANIHNIAVDGNFDDCQQIVKELFLDEELNAVCDLSGVNSINWVRLAIQTVYYFVTALKMGRASYVVPTGNFGDIFAGYVAKRMGLPIDKLAVAVNVNDIMHRVIATGEYETSNVTPTSSPSMDIQVASNFERLLFEASGRDSDRIVELMATFSEFRRMSIPEDLMKNIQDDFVSGRATETEVSNMIADHYRRFGETIDPHSAIGLCVASQLRAEGVLTGKVVSLATAHAAKFPNAVEKACGVSPALPDRYRDLFDREERMTVAPANLADIREIVVSRSIGPIGNGAA